MEMRQFRQFIAVAEEMSFRRAAERLHMAQPPLTAAIKKIESELGVMLMERTSRIIRLTDSGQIFLEEARRVVAQADRAISAARTAVDGFEGSLRITFLPVLAHNHLPHILREFRQRYPKVVLELTEAPTASQVELLTNDQADIGLLVPPIPQEMPLAIETVFRDHLVAAISDKHPLAFEKTITLDALRDDAWIIPPQHQSPGFGASLIKACVAAGFMPAMVQHAVQIGTILGLVSGELGVCLVPSKLAKPPRGVVFLNVVGPGTPIDYELSAARRSTEDKTSVMAFLEITRATMSAKHDV